MDKDVVDHAFENLSPRFIVWCLYRNTLSNGEQLGKINLMGLRLDRLLFMSSPPSS